MATNQTVLWEEIWKRTPNTKHFHLADGSKQAIIYLNDIHYEDESGNYQNIDTALHDEADMDLWDFPVTKHGVDEFKLAKDRAKADKAANKLNRDNHDFQALKVPFAAKIPRNWKRGYSIGKGVDKLTFKPVGASPSKGYVTEGKDNEIVYQDAWNDVDVTLGVTGRGVKETLTLKTNKAPTKFVFQVVGNIVDDLTAGELKLQPAWLKDASGIERDVPQTIRREATGVFLDITYDITGLAFPVAIDPTVSIPSSTTGWIDSHVDRSLPTSNYGTSFNLYVGENNGGYQRYFSYTKIPLDSIPVGSAVSSATLYETQLTSTAVSYGREANICLGSWAETTITYNTQPSTDSTVYTLGHAGGTTPFVISSDVTNMVKRWITDGLPNYGYRWGMSTYAWSTDNYSCYFASRENTTYTNLALSVTYNTPPTVPTVTAPNGGETWNASHTITWTAATDSDTAQASLQYHIQVSTDTGATWSDIVALTAAGAISYTYDFTPVAQTSTALVRIRAYDGSLYGLYDQSDGVFTIQHNQAPTAPTLLAPDGGTLKDRAQVIHLSWQHNDPNTPDPQSKFDLQYSTDGGTIWTTVTQVTTNQYYDVPANIFPHGNVLWKVRTYDQAGLSGPYSAQATFLAGDKPAAATITAPTGVVAVARPIVQWSSVGQTAYQVQVLDSLSAVAWDSGEVVSTNKAQTIGIDLANSANYTIQVRIKNSDGLWSDWATSAITVSYTPPAVPVIVVTTQTGYISIAITNPVPQGTEPAVSSNDLYRRKLGELSWTRIVVGITANGSYKDYATAGGVTYEYYARAQGANGTFRDSLTVSTSITLTDVWLFDVANPEGTVHQYSYNSKRDSKWQADVTMMQYAGRKRAVAEFGETDEGRISVTLDLLSDSNDLTSLESLIYAKSTCLYRDGRGRKMYGIIAVLPVSDEVYGNAVTIEVIENDHSEEV